MSLQSKRLVVLSAALVAIMALVIVAVIHFRATSGGADGNDLGVGPFEIADAANRDFEGAPALALSFTHPMSARNGHDDHIQVFEMPQRAADGVQARQADDDDQRPSVAKPQVSTSADDVKTDGGKLVKGAWVVADNPRVLYFPHIKPQTRYVIRVSAGIASASGEKLSADGRYSVLTATLSPAYFFPSLGMVLPASQNGGLPVTTVNVPEVDIQFLRVKPDQLPRFLDKVIGGPRNVQSRQRDDDDDYLDEGGGDWRATNLKGAINHWSLDAMGKLTDSVFVGRFLTEQKPNKRSVTFIPVEEIKELREPGIYIAVMSQPNRFRVEYQVTYFYVSDLGLSARLFAKGADVYVSSLTSGKAVSGVEVAWLDEAAKVVAHAQTDGDGHAAFVERPASAKVVVARHRQQISMITLKEPALDLSEYNVTGLPGRPVRLFAYSGRNLYRPGEQFDVSVLARDPDGRTVAPQPIQAILRRPDGKSQFTDSWSPDAKVGGYYQRRLELPADAPTGFWTLELRSDPADKLATTSYRFGVEEFLPERMKLDLSSQQATVSPRESLRIAVKGSYLYGAPASGNQLVGVAVFERQKNPLARKLPGFEFGDIDEENARDRIELERETLDENGELDLEVDLSPAKGRRSPYSVRTTLSLLETGGRPVVRNFERDIWPAPVMVGLRPLFSGDYAREGSLAQFEVVRVNAEGTLLAGQSLPVRLFRENRDYYWRFDDQRGWHSGFTETDELVDTGSVGIAQGGRGKLSLPVKYGRYRLEITDPETRLVSKLRFYAGWNARGEEGQGVRPDRVAMKFDKPAYKEGETAKLTITPPHAGEALVTVEGDQTLWLKRVTVPVGGATIDVPVHKDWKRHDLYVSVAVMRPGSSGEKVTPARALGLAHLPLEREDRKMIVALEAPKKVLPDSKLKVKVKAPAAAGQQAIVTVSAVDVGILNITRFVTPDPHGHFFGKQRYGADQYDVYGRLIEKMAGKKGRLKFGGDAAPKVTKSLPKKVMLVDLFSGPVALNAQGEADIVLNVPDFNGTLRLMAVVAAPDTFGNAELETVVAAPLVAELMMPRFLTVGDSATVAVDLHNLSGSTQTLALRVLSGAGLKLTNSEREVTLKDQQKQTVRFGMEAGSALGLTDVRVVVSSNGGIKLERSFGLQVQAATPLQQVSKLLAIGPGESIEVKEAELGGFIRGTVQSHLVISDQAPIDVRGAIQGLLVYPYGCAEQTTSTAYPHVFVDEEGARRFGLKVYSREQRADMLGKAIARLGAMQAPNGGFSLWGNVSETQYWLSAYVSNFLIDAREQEFDVPQAMHRNAMEFLLKNLQEGAAGLPRGKVAYREDGWRDHRYAGAGRFGVLAYGAYVLARESKAPLSTLRQMFELREQAHSGLALIHLGLALQRMGDENRAQTALAEGVKKGRDAGYWWGDYGSPVRDAALSYALLEHHKLKVDGKDNLVAIAAAELGKSRHTSTQEKLALFLLGRNLSTKTDNEARWTVELADPQRRETLTASGPVFRSLAVATLQGGLRLKNTHKAKLYVQLNMSGNPAKMPANRSDAIALSRELFEADGTPLRSRALRVGESVIVRINVDARIGLNTGMVVDKIPAGLEIENLNLSQGEGMGSTTIGGVNPADAMQDARIQHVEFRDDRFVVAARLQGTLRLYYRARVVTPGKFVFPPTYAEDMYRPDVYGLAVSDATLTVTDARQAKEEASTAALTAQP